MRFKPGDRVVVVVDSHINTLELGSKTVIKGYRKFEKDFGHAYSVEGSTQGYYESELEFEAIIGSPLYEALK